MATYHFVGIKGTGMSALAQVLADMGYIVQGSDIEKHFFTEDALIKKGIRILSFDASNIHKGLTVIAGNAFKDDHLEIKKAFELGVPVIRYHHFLGEWLKKYTSIAVSGAHGKTSTTGMLAHVMSGMAPTSYIIGDGTGGGTDNSKYFVFEACEYRRHFLSYQPDYAIMTNIDFDHPDYFTGIEDVFSAFSELAMQVKQAIFANGDDEYLQMLQAKVPVLFYGLSEDNDYQGRNIQRHVGGTTFDVYIRNNFYGTFTIPTYGMHSVMNALAVIAVAHYENVDKKKLEERLLSFSGVKRRFSEKILNHQVIIDDYAHHPTEIRATLDAARQKFPEKEIVAIFQPHTFTRTQKFLNDFVDALQEANQVYLCDIFGSAREKEGILSIEDVCAKISGAKKLTEQNIYMLKEHKDSVLIFMGAGDVQKYITAYEEYLASEG